MLLINAFSPNMLAGSAGVHFSDISPEWAARHARKGIESAVGHADTAALFSAILGVPVAAERKTALLSKGDTALLGQYSGPRLPEGATELPEGASIRWMLVYVCE